MRMNLAKVLLPAALLFAFGAHAEFANWLKRANPSELAVTVRVSDECGISEQNVLGAVHGVLIRARIKPLVFDYSADYFRLTVKVDCLRERAFVINADFRDVVTDMSVRYGDGTMLFGTYGGNTPYVLDGVKEVTELAITAYLEANLDLSPEFTSTPYARSNPRSSFSIAVISGLQPIKSAGRL